MSDPKHLTPSARPRRARLYLIEDVDSEMWTGAVWSDVFGLAARYTTLRGASEALCRITPGTERKRFPLRVSVRRS